jgi:hypothetical protein
LNLELPMQRATKWRRMPHDFSWLPVSVVLLAVLCLAGAVGAQDDPVVLIDATVLPPPNDGLSDEALGQKLQGGGTDSATVDGPASTAPPPAAHPALGSRADSRVSVAAADGAAKALPSCVGIDVRSSNGQLFADSFESGGISAWGQADSVLSADRALDLLFDVFFDGTLIGDHVLHLRLTTPRGHHYQTLSVPISGDTSLLGAQRHLEGYPFAVDVQVLEAIDATTSSAGLRLPVAGTSIVTHGLYGRWTAQAYVDQTVEPCGPSAEFVLAP